MHQQTGATRLLFEIASLTSMGQIDDWAVRGLPRNNTLHAADALLIEDAFRQKIAELQPLPDRQSETPLPQVSSPSEVALHANGTTAEPDQPPKPLRFRALRCHAQTAPTARQAPPRVCRGPALCRVRTPALRRPSSTLHTTQGTRSQSRQWAPDGAGYRHASSGDPSLRSKSSTGGHGWASTQSPSQTSSGLKLIQASRSPSNTFKLTLSAPSRLRPHDIAQTNRSQSAAMPKTVPDREARPVNSAPHAMQFAMA